MYVYKHHETTIGSARILLQYPATVRTLPRLGAQCPVIKETGLKLHREGFGV